MTEKINKFNALAYAISKLGPPHEISKNRFAEADHGFVSDCHLWGLRDFLCLAVDEWNDGDQSTAGGAGPARWDGLVVVRNNEDGTLRSEYEEQARAMIDEYAEATK